MPDIIISAKYAVGDKAVIAIETSNRMLYYIAKVVAIKNVMPDVDANGTDIITYTVELYTPNPVNKVQMDVTETELQDVSIFTTAFASF
ncbi:hypothetical protein [Paenibacillus massiliensis]|uniref:hypothetical protein n=1 Tax=Paenibacillus massiliensis TaxID=225917 RepID=UPI000364F19D|nr:hypothetical protein [Paenibacillus massiliensis]